MRDKYEQVYRMNEEDDKKGNWYKGSGGGGGVSEGDEIYVSDKMIDEQFTFALHSPNCVVNCQRKSKLNSQEASSNKHQLLHRKEENNGRWEC